MTLGELSVTLVLLASLGLVASRFGLSAIPAYLLAGLLLGPNEPKVLSLIQPEPVTGAQPDDVIQTGDTLVTVGKAGSYAAFRALLGGSA